MSVVTDRSDAKPEGSEFQRAVQRLESLEKSVRASVDQESVVEAEFALRLAIMRAYGGKRVRSAPGEGAKQRILELLKSRCGEWVPGWEIHAVSRIGEWARRVRELHVEDGYDIIEEGGSYKLVALEPDEVVAARWRVLNATRRERGSARDRVLSLLQRRVGEVVSRDDLDYVAKIKEGSRRVRELRDESGWPIESHIDARDLKPGEYRLLSIDPLMKRDASQRLYPEDLRHRIFERDNFTCQVCGRDRAVADRAGDTRFYLEVHHRHAVAEELPGLSEAELNNETNLLTLCHRCHTLETAKLQRRQRSKRQAKRDGA